jgi:ABC-2 type transport system permease protein
MDGKYISLFSIMRKEFFRIIRIWMQTLLPPVITMGLYFIIFGKFIGSQVSDINGFSYMEFIIPGIIMMAVITNSYSNVVSSFFGAKFQRSIEELLVSPTPNWIIILGYTFGGMMRGLMVGFLVTLLSLVFGQLHIHNVWAILAFVLLTSLVFSLAGIINAVFAKKFDDISIIPTFVLTPLTYLSGVFYSIALLPPVWQALSKLNPILYMVNGFRYGFLGFSDINVFLGFGMLVLFAIVLFAINMYLLKKGVGLRS